MFNDTKLSGGAAGGFIGRQPVTSDCEIVPSPVPEDVRLIGVRFKPEIGKKDGF